MPLFLDISMCWVLMACGAFVSSRDAIKPSSKAPNVNREIAVILKVDGYAGSDGRSR